MKLQNIWLLPVILLLVAVLAGCGQDSQQAADESNPEATEPDASQEASITENKKQSGRFLYNEDRPDMMVAPTREQAVKVLNAIQSTIKAKDFEALLKHFHACPQWDAKRSESQVRSLLLVGGSPPRQQSLLPSVIEELSQDGEWGRADELFDKERLRRRVAFHNVKADDCYSLVLKNGKAETIFHWNGKEFTILHYSEPVIKERLGKDVEKCIHGIQGKDNSGRALSFYLLGQMGPDAESAIPEILKLLIHDDRSYRIEAAILLWKIDRLSSASVPPLLDELADTKSNVYSRVMAAEGLGIIGPQASGAAAKLRSAMGETQPELRLSAAWALWKTTGDSKSTRPVMLDLLNDSNLNVFFGAAKTLGEMGWDKESLAAIIAALESDPDRSFTMRQLTQDLVQTLTSEDVEIRRKAIVVLSKNGEPEQLVRDALKKALKDEDPKVRDLATEALKNLRSDQ